MSGTNDLAKNIFLAHFEIVQNLYHFGKAPACGMIHQKTLFQKFSKNLLKRFFGRGGEQ